MSSQYFGRRRAYNKYAFLSFQKKQVEDHFHFLKCRIEQNVLICTGYVQPEGCNKQYKVQIRYVVGKEPKSTILSPFIEPSKHIHMYQDHSLCLHYPPDMEWNERTAIYKYTIPWLIEWIIFYELYLVNGNKWEGRESPNHIVESDKNIDVDLE
jgi:hypothetical protein